jgi:hypothetical protein
MSTIKRVILYKHGVGYFEKRHKIKDKQSIDCFFKSREMNDVLKSLTIIDCGGGLISSVSYDSTTPIEKLLEDISIRIPDENSLKSLIAQIKGARIQIIVGKDEIQGSVLGLDPLTRTEHDAVITTDRLTILDAGGEMKSFNLEEIKSLKVLDENIQRDLEFYLKTIIFSQKKDLKKLTIFAVGEGERDMLISYVLESPVWKTTYRVILGKDEKPLLQGWAVVDNTQDEDWEDIELSLVSGLPVSFVHDLYNPRFKRRPIVQVKDEGSIAPPSFEEGYAPAPSMPMAEEPFAMAAFDLAESFEAPAAPSPRAMKMGGRAKARMASPGAADMGAVEMALKSSVEVKTMTQKVGDFFEYRIANPVTIKRNQSALVPIIDQPFKGERILIYNETNRPTNPMACLEMTNDTGLTLEGGPLTIYHSETYLGESMLEFTKPDEKKFIPYAVELGCHIEKMEFFSDEPVFYISVAGGTMRTHYYRKREKTYRIKHKNKEKARLIIEHPREVDWELVDTQAPVETTQSFYRFELSLPKEGEYSLVVRDKRIYWTHYTLNNLNEEVIVSFLSQKFMDEKTAQSVRKLIELQKSKSDMEREVSNKRGEIQGIYKDQERLRSNIATLSASREEANLKERFVAKLSEQENQIEQNEKTIKELQAKIEQATMDINALLLTLQYEKRL